MFVLVCMCVCVCIYVYISLSISIYIALCVYYVSVLLLGMGTSSMLIHSDLKSTSDCGLLMNSSGDMSPLPSSRETQP